MVERDKNGIYLSQVTYIEKVLAIFGMEECKRVVTPALDPPGTESPKLESDVPYKQAIGSLLYISTRTRPDIAYAVGYVARQMHDPTEEDWIAVKRIFRYLQSTKNLRLKYSMQNSEILGYSDASYASNSKDRKSTSGYIFISNGPISWRSKKQPIVSISSVEAEEIASEINSEISPKVILLEDNQAAIKLAKNEILSDHSKHIDV